MATRTMGPVVIGEITFGEWCDICNFSEILVAPVFVLSDDGISQLGTYRCCRRCNPPEGGR
jgi:hypothetical protein